MSDWLLVHAPVIALALSLLALVVSAFSLGWNVYRDVVLKPRVKVELGLRITYGTATDGALVESGAPFVLLAGINHGPGDVVCKAAVLRRSSFLRSLFQEFPYGFIMVDHAHPHCSELPKRLAIGEEVGIIFPCTGKEHFLEAKPSRVGISDSFGRTHWARRKDLRRAYRQFKKDFGTLGRSVQDESAKSLKEVA